MRPLYLVVDPISFLLLLSRFFCREHLSFSPIQISTVEEVRFPEISFQTNRIDFNFISFKKRTCQYIRGRCDLQHEDTKHNDTQHKDTQHEDTQHKDTQHKDTQQ
jgi:hypothetical protein